MPGAPSSPASTLSPDGTEPAARRQGQGAGRPQGHADAERGAAIAVDTKDLVVLVHADPHADHVRKAASSWRRRASAT